MARIVVEHPDGRRVSVLESAFDDPDANPFNQERQIYSTDGRNETQRGRPSEERLSLQQEGFIPVGRITRSGREHGLEGD